MEKSKPELPNASNSATRSATQVILKAHQVRPYKLFNDFLNQYHVNEVTPYWANRFYLEVMWCYPLPLRQATWNALKELYPPPFEARALPYPLLTRYLQEDFETLLAKIPPRNNPARGAHLLVLLCGLDEEHLYYQRFELVKSTRTPGGFVRVMPSRFGEKPRSVPITQAVYEDVELYLKTGAQRTKRIGKMPVAKYHNALHEYLIRNNVPEVVRASIYGRWSAQKFQRATELYGLFKTQLGCF